MADRKFEAVILGATGFTGFQVVKKFHERGVCKRWAIAGRRKEAVEKLQQEWQVPDVIVADVTDYASLVNMAKSTCLVLNATGPYRFLGEPVVRACIESGADYIDLCGEPEFMERMLLNHGDAAQQAGVIVCHACAFDSIPADLGIMRCAQLYDKAGGECAHVELFHSIEAPLGYTGHITTFQAAVAGMGSVGDLKKVRKQLEAKYGKIPSGTKIDGPLPDRGGPWFTEPRLARFALPFIGADASVVRSSRRTFMSILKKPGVEKLMPQFGIYFTLAYRSSLYKLVSGGLIFNILSRYKWGRDLLLTFPSIFTFGAFSEAGPTLEQMANNKWRGDFFASGVVGGARKKLTLVAEINDPGYIGTAAMFAVVAETVLQERDRCAKGGVFTPAALLADTTIVERLAGKGVGLEFKVLESELP